ncbi:positive regulator of sigma E activity [Sporosarcina luteola]|nr:positive regulator of sigma E activity [Sporosarcina luteola]
MFSFDTFKDKRYWILLCPYLLILVVFSIVASSEMLANTLITYLLLLLYAASFWAIYHLWKYLGDKKKKK